MILAWRNDPAAVAASLSGVEVQPAEHDAWFAQALSDPCRVVWVAEEHGRAIGSVRLDLDPLGAARAVVSIALAPQARGRRLATPLLGVVTAAAAQEFGLRSLQAVIKSTNVRSLRAFLAAGYRERSRDQQTIILERELPARRTS